MTSKIKKILGVMLALILIVSTGLGNVNATQGANQDASQKSGTITVTGTTAGKEYRVYKIFDLTLGGPEKNNVEYTISKDWEHFFQGKVGGKYITEKSKDSNEKNLSPIVVKVQENGKTKYVKKYINITDDNIVEFAKAVNGEIADKNPEDKKTASGDTLPFDKLALGYYLVYPKGASEAVQDQISVVSLTSTQPGAKIKVKGKYPTIKKYAKDVNNVERISYDYGETITYTLTGKVPYTTGYNTYKYTITDKLSQGLDLIEDSVVVKIGDPETTNLIYKEEELKQGGVISKTVENISEKEDGTLYTTKLELDFKGIKELSEEYAGKEITVTYEATLNKDAVIGQKGNPNKVVLQYSNDPHRDTLEEVKDGKNVYTGAIKVIKHNDKNYEGKGDVDEANLLDGAKFKLKNEAGEFYHLNKDENRVEWVTKDKADEKITGKDGVVEFKGLKNGTYYLEETEAPDGYNKLTSPVEVVVDYKTQTNTVYQKKSVLNNAGIVLPVTGGRGTTLFAVLGGGIILLAAYNLKKDKFKKKGTR